MNRKPMIVTYQNEEIREYGCCSQTCGGTPATQTYPENHKDRTTLRKLLSLFKPL